MSKVERRIIFVVYFLLGLIIEAFIWWLFPNTGLGGLICYPLAIFFCLIFGFLIYRLAKIRTQKLQIALLSLGFLIFQFFLQLNIHPQDFGGSVFEKLSSFRKAYKNYNSIQYNQFTYLTNEEKIAFYQKFRDKLPESFITLGIETDSNSLEYNPRVYLVENKNNHLVYDSSKLKILENDSNTVIIENPGKLNERSYKAHKNFMKIGKGGYGDENYSLNIEEDHLVLDTGIEKAFYSLLSLSK